MGNLTQLEIFKKATAHEYTGQYLFYADFTPDLRERILKKFNLEKDADLREFFGMYNPEDVSLKRPKDYTEPDFSVYYRDVEIPEGAYIDSIGVLHVPGSMYHFTHYVSPLRNAQSFEEIEQFPYPDYSGFSDEGMKQEVNRIHAQGRVASCWIGHMYEDSWQIRGYEQFLEDMILRPEWCEYILDRIKERNMKVAVAAAKAGVDVITTGDDVANQITLMFSPDQWRRFMKPRWAEVYAAAKSIKPDLKIWYHSDGNISLIIPELIEIGVDILNPIQPECLDPVEVKKKYGDRIVLDGTIGTQTVMPFGTAGDVREMVRRMVSEVGRDGALILSPTHVLEPEVPIDNILAFVEAVKEING